MNIFSENITPPCYTIVKFTKHNFADSRGISLLEALHSGGWRFVSVKSPIAII